MPLNLGSILSVATRALGAIVTAVPAVQAFQTQFRNGSGADKKAAVLALVQAELSAAELVAGRDLATDPDVIAAAGVVIDGVRAFHKLLERKVGAAAV